MKNELENNELDLEHLLRSKSWDQLTEKEQSEVAQVVTGREEYDRLFALVHSLKASSGIHETELRPSADVRNSLLAAFDNEKKKRRARWWNNLNYFLNESIRFDIPAVRISIAAVLLFVVVFSAVKFMDNEQDTPQVADNKPVEVKKNAPVETKAPENNVVVQPKIVQPSNDTLVIDEFHPPVPEVNNQPIVVTPFLPDTTANRIALVPDSALVAPLAIVVPQSLNVTCCGASNGSITPTAVTGGTYNWTNSGTFNGTAVAITNGLPPRSRSLANDEAVMDVFFAVK